MACEDVNSKLVEVVTAANVDDEDHVGNNLISYHVFQIGILLNIGLR